MQIVISCSILMLLPMLYFQCQGLNTGSRVPFFPYLFSSGREAILPSCDMKQFSIEKSYAVTFLAVAALTGQPCGMLYLRMSFLLVHTDSFQFLSIHFQNVLNLSLANRSPLQSQNHCPAIKHCVSLKTQCSLSLCPSAPLLSSNLSPPFLPPSQHLDISIHPVMGFQILGKCLNIFSYLSLMNFEVH